jgi:hypothetical protein
VGRDFEEVGHHVVWELGVVDSMNVDVLSEGIIGCDEDLCKVLRDGFDGHGRVGYHPDLVIFMGALRCRTWRHSRITSHDGGSIVVIEAGVVGW